MFGTETRDSTDCFVFEFERRVGPAYESVPDQVHAVTDVTRRRMKREVIDVEDGGRRPITGCHMTIVQNPVRLPDLVQAVQLVKDSEVGSLSRDGRVAEEPTLGWKQRIPCLVSDQATVGKCLVEGKGMSVQRHWYGFNRALTQSPGEEMTHGQCLADIHWEHTYMAGNNALREN